MAIDKLQDRIRKLKSPLALDLFAQAEHIPPQLMSGEKSFMQAYGAYCCELLAQVKDTVAAVRLDAGMFALYGAEGYDTLRQLSQQAHKHGLYVLLQVHEPLSKRSAESAAKLLFATDYPVYFDGIVITAYIGSDAIAPFVDFLKSARKDLFVVARTSNRSAPEMQELRSGSRLAYVAKADIVKRFADEMNSKCGYSGIGLVAAAASADCLRTLRAKYSNIFLWLDGCDYPNANAKNCSAAFDRLGHGAIACVGLSVMAAWQERVDDADYCTAAVKAVERHKRNLLRYVTVL